MDTDYYDPKTIIEDPDMSAVNIDLDGTEHDNELLSIAQCLADGIRDLEYSDIDPEQTTADANDPESIFFHELKKKRDALQWDGLRFEELTATEVAELAKEHRDEG